MGGSAQNPPNQSLQSLGQGTTTGGNMLSSPPPTGAGTTQTTVAPAAPMSAQTSQPWIWPDQMGGMQPPNYGQPGQINQSILAQLLGTQSA
jgi:hypothetical protein